MENYAQGYTERSSRSFTLGTRYTNFNRSIVKQTPFVSPPPVSPTPVVEDDKGKDDEKDDTKEIKDPETPPVANSTSEESDPKTESPKEATGTGINESDESP